MVFAVIQAVNILFQRTDGFHQRTFEILADTHNLACGFHLSRQCTFRCNKFIKRPFRDFDNHIIKGRFKAGVCFAGNRILDFIQGITQSDLGSNFGDRVTRCLGS